MNIKKFLKNTALYSVLTCFSTLSTFGISFDFTDPKNVNNAQFLLDAPLEQISGFANGVSGNINFDPANPENISGIINISSDSVTVGNPMMLDHLKASKWLDVSTHKNIAFEAESLSNLKNVGQALVADVTGTFTMKGIAKKITVPVEFMFLKDKLGARMGKNDLKGDLLVVRSDFSVNRSDFNIMAGKKEDKVSNKIEVSLRVVGASSK